MAINTNVNRFGNVMQDIGKAYKYCTKQFAINNTTMYLIQIVYNSEPCTQKHLCDIMWLPRQTVNTVVKDYMRNDFLKVAESAENRQQKQILLTEKGWKYYEHILLPILEEAFVLV